MGYAILTKKDFEKVVSKLNKNKLMVISGVPLQIKSGSKKSNKSISFQFMNDMFIKPDFIGDIIQSEKFCVIVMDKKHIKEKYHPKKLGEK